jgi:BASS family bile acid:Na+ symporter
MTIDQAINVLVTVTLVEMMVAIGLGVTFAELAAVARTWRLVARAVVANYVCVPAVTVGLLLLFQAQPMVAAGFLILAVCPGAPYGPPCTAIARGPVSVAVGLMVLMAGSSALVAPLLLALLLPVTTGDEPLKVDAVKMVFTLLATQLAPLGAGLLVRQWRPALASRLLQPALLASKALNLLVVGVILVTQGHLFAEIRLLGFVGMLLLLVACWAAGFLLAGPDNDNRKAMTLGTSLRNVGLGLVIATGAFPGTPAVTAVLVYGLLEVLGSLLLAVWWGRLDRGAKGPLGKKERESVARDGITG